MAMSDVIVGYWDGVDAASYGIQMYWSASTPYTTSEGTFTNISWDLQVYCGFASSSAGSWSEDTQCYINIDGNRQLVFEGTFSFRDSVYRNWTTVFSSGSSPTPVKYNSDGTKSVYLGFDFLLNTIATKPRTGSGDGYVSDTVTLDPVPVLVDITYHSNYTPGVADHVQSVTKNVSTPVWDGSGWTRAGYQLTGWNTASDGSGTQYSTSSSITTSADMDLYAIWSPQVTFDANILNPSGSTSPVYINYYTGSKLTLNGFSKTNLEFFRWATYPLGTGTVYNDNELVVVVPDGGVHKVIDAPTTLYAIWRAMITYHANYSGSSAIREQTVYGRSTSSSEFEGNAVTMAPSSTFSRQDYRIVEWNTQQDGSGTSYIPGQQYSAGTINSSIDLYAIWAENLVNITYHPNYTGGPANHTDSVTPGVATTVWNGSTWSRTGYKLIGWNTQSNGSGTPYPIGSSITVDAATDLYAVWHQNFKWIDGEGDGYVIAGTPTTTVTANKVNAFQRELHTYISSSYTPTTVQSNEIMRATLYNAMANTLANASGAVFPTVSVGSATKADGDGSINNLMAGLNQYAKYL